MIHRFGMVDVVCVAGVGWIVVGSLLVCNIDLVSCDEWCCEIYDCCLVECNIATIALGAMMNVSTPFVATFHFVLFDFWIYWVAMLW